MIPLAFLLAFCVPSARAESFQSWSARAAREEREKDLDAAFKSWSNALSVWRESDGKPAKAKALCTRAAIREKKGEDAAALKDWSDCLALDKKNAKAFHARGALKLKGGKAAEAIDDFYKAVALDIGFGRAYADRARAYEASGETAFAREDYKHACELGVKDACANTKGSPRPKTGGGRAFSTHVSLGSAVYTQSVKVRPGRQTTETGRQGDYNVVLTASIKAKGNDFLLEYLVELKRSDGNRGVQFISVARLRPGDRVTTLDCGEWKIAVSLDAPQAADQAPDWRPDGRNLRVSAFATDRTCHFVQDASGSESSVIDSWRPEGQSTLGYMFNAIPTPTAGGTYRLKYLIEQLPFQVQGEETLSWGARKSSAEGKAEFLIEGGVTSAGKAPPEATPVTKPAESTPTPEPAPGPEAAEPPPEVPAGPRPVQAVPRPADAGKAAATRFNACRRRLDACTEGGDSYGACIGRAVACETKASPGCCPEACLRAYRKATKDRSEASAYREFFASDSACALPKASDDD